jgi:hypothetical protein
MDGMQIDGQLCRQCRGRCCLGHPGVWSEPRRFFSIFTAAAIPSAFELRQVLEQQQLTLRDLGGVLVPAPQNTERGCFAQQEMGCTYPPETRPCQCLALTPNLETLLDDQIHCSLPPEFGSNSARENWRPFQALLRQTLRKERDFSGVTL